MLHRKLLEVLNHLTIAERKQLRLFLTSPYFSNTINASEIVRLYDHIIQHDAKEEHPALSKEVVFRMFFPNGQFQEKIKSPLDALTSELFGLVRRFLAQVSVERESREISEYLALAQFYRKFAYEERFWQTIQTLRKMQRQFPLRDAQCFFEQFKIEDEELKFRGMYNTFEDEMNLNAVHKNLDLYYSILKLDYTSYFEYQKRFAQVEKLPETPLVEDIINLSCEGGLLDTPINRIYLLLLNLLKNPEDEASLEMWERLLIQYEPVISPERYKNLMTLYRFLWHQKYNKVGDDFSRRRIFEIYQKHLEKGYFYFDGLIPFTAFRNLVMFALIIGEFDWVKSFLDAHPHERIGGTRYPAEIHSLNLAEYYFYIKKYAEAREHLVYRPFEHPTVSILADLLLVKIYYETQNELLESRMKALDQKVRRSKLSQETKNRYYNFLKKLDKVIKYGSQARNPKRARLVESIKTMPDLIAREWPLEKLGEG